MNRKKTSPDFENIRKEIARRLQAGLPLAGMIAATALLTGCHEHSENFPAGSVPRDPALYERQTEKPKPIQPNKNDKSEQCPLRTVGMTAPSKAEPNRQNETEDEVTSGDAPEMPPSNQKNETRSAATRGKMLLNTDK